MESRSQSWLVKGRSRSPVRARIVCFAAAGGGVAQFLRRSHELPPGIELVGVRLPGRESRIHETPLIDIEDIVHQASDAIRHIADLPLYFMGHSMGGCISYEVAKRLRKAHGILPVRLMAVAARAPHLGSPLSTLCALADDEFVRALARNGGIPWEVLDNHDVLRMALPALRADLLALDRYRVQAAEPLLSGLQVIGGDADRLVNHDDLRGWAAYAAGEFMLRVVPGGHFLIHHRWHELVALLLDPAAH